MRHGDATVRHAVETYGARIRIDDALKILRVSTSTLYAGIKTGKYPAQVDRGLWSTEAIARAAAGLPITQVDEHAEDDPFS